MKLDQVTAAIRPRSAYEDVDLGFAMARDAAAPIWKSWFAVTLPVFLACNGLAAWLGLQWLAGWMMWWLKPMFDRNEVAVVMDGDEFVGLITRVDLINHLRLQD